jgi:hypothetical protein
MGNGERPTNTICVSLVDVRISERHRRSINASKVEQYRQWLEQGREAPPVRLARDGAGYVVRDGRHRVAAAVAAGYADIDAVLSAVARLILALTRRAGRARGRGLLTARAAAGRRRSSTARTTHPGMSGWQNASLAPRQGGFDSRRLHLAWGRSTRRESAPLGFLVVAHAKPG